MKITQDIYLICSKAGVKRMQIVAGVRRMNLKVGEIAVKVSVSIDEELFNKEVPKVKLDIK